MLHLSEGCVVCKSAVLVGDISIGPGTIVHPFARIIARTGPVLIIIKINVIKNLNERIKLTVIV